MTNEITSNDAMNVTIDSVCGGGTELRKFVPAAPEQAAALAAIKDGDASAWDAFDVVVVAFSGGKDSLAAVLNLLDLGCPREKIELWHHLIDGAEGERRIMDWPITSAYCRAVAEHMGIPLRMSWKEGGFLGEMMRDATPTAPTSFEAADGATISKGGKGPAGTRRRFPALSADLTTRWCSAYLKVDVGHVVMRNDPKFANARALFVTGERREESRNRAKYPEIEAHKSSNRRRVVTHWRNVIDWTERQVWDRIAASGIEAHPCYRAGFSRCSCALCIFGNADQFATARDLLPEQFAALAAVEQDLGFTMQKKATLSEHADKGRSLVPADLSPAVRAACAATVYDLPIIAETWTTPAGAYRHQGGPV